MNKEIAIDQKIVLPDHVDVTKKIEVCRLKGGKCMCTAGFDEVISLHPTFSTSYRYRAGIYLYHSHEFEKAVFDYNKWLELEDYWEEEENTLEIKKVRMIVLYDRGLAYYMLRNFPKAIEDLTCFSRWATILFKRYGKDKVKKRFPSSDYKTSIQYLAQRSNQILGDLYLRLNLHEKALSSFLQSMDGTIDDEITGCACPEPNCPNQTKEQFKSAIICFTKELEINPKKFELYYHRGRIHRLLKNNEASAYDLSISVEKIPNHPNIAEFYRFRGRCYSDLGHSEKCVNDLTKLIELDPKYERDTEIMTALGVNLFNIERYRESIVDLSKSIEINPTYDAYLFRSRASTCINMHEQAVDDAKKCIEMDKKKGLVVQGEVYFGWGKYNKAIKVFKQAQKLMEITHSERKTVKEESAYIGEDVVLKKELASCYERLEKWKMALKYINESLSPKPTLGASADPREYWKDGRICGLYRIRKECHMGLGRFKEALKDINSAIANHPNCHILECNLGDRAICYYVLGYYKLVLDDLDKVLDMGILRKADPFDMCILYHNLAGVYFKLEMWKKSRQNIFEAIKCAKTEDSNVILSRCYYMLGVVENEKGGKSVEKYYTKSIQLDPMNFRALYNRCIMYRNMGDKKKSMVDLKRLKKLEKKRSEEEELIIEKLLENLKRNESQRRGLVLTPVFYKDVNLEMNGFVGLEKRCHGCRKKVKKKRRCGGCLVVFYCSTKCQKSDWIEHRKTCQILE